jgi:hypothetical protein
MCGAFPTKRLRTSGSEPLVDKNDAASKNGVVNKRCVLRKNDALDSNDVEQNADWRRERDSNPRYGFKPV